MTCQYCNGEARLVDSSIVYGKSYGLIYFCQPCDAYVGIHKGTTTPLGTLANRETRFWRNRAHAAFDPLWKKDSPARRFEKRGHAYQWLAEQLGIPVQQCHIAMFDRDRCAEVVRICSPAEVSL